MGQALVTMMNAVGTEWVKPGLPRMIIVILVNFVKCLSVILLILLIVFIFIDILLTFFTVLYNGCCLSNENIKV